MWLVGCLEESKTHVESRAWERIVFRVKRTYNIFLSESKVKQIILDIMKTATIKDYDSIDKVTLLPKYWIRTKYPATFYLFLHLCIIEDKENGQRKIKTLYTNFDVWDWDSKLKFKKN